jgi:DNA topoisomerase-3
MLDGIFGRLRRALEKTALQHQLRMDPDVFDKALEKLWIHGGALVDFAENVSRGHDRWREPYIGRATRSSSNST